MPLRARVAGITGKAGLLELHYQKNYVRDYSVDLSGNSLVDGNFNPSSVLRFEQTVIIRPDWKVEIGLEFKAAKTFSLKWTAGCGVRVYDGGYVNVSQLFLSINKYF